jgi:hypothetical protein
VRVIHIPLHLVVDDDHGDYQGDGDDDLALDALREAIAGAVRLNAVQVFVGAATYAVGRRDAG